MADAPTVADVVIDYLHAAGVRKIFGYPGGPTIELMEAARRREVATVLARREGTAAIMAEAYGMLLPAPGVCVSTLGPGSTALVPGVASAFMDRVPMIAISGQISTRREPTFTHQVVDHNRLFAPIAKWTSKLAPHTVATVMRKALRIAFAERPGSVHLTLNTDLAAEHASDAYLRLPPTRATASSSRVVVHGEVHPAALLNRSRRPVALVGMAALRSDSSEAVRGFAEHYSMPVVVTPVAKGVLAEDHPLFAGVIDMAANQVVWDLLGSADLVITVGFDPVELIKDWNVTAPVLHVDAVPNLDQLYPADIEMIGHIPALLDELGEAPAPGERWPADAVTAHREQLRASYYSGYQKGDLNPTDVVDLLVEATSPETIVTTDVGSHKLLVGQGWTTTQPKTFLVSNGLSAMGFALPAAISAKLVHPNRPVVCTVGDGGLAMVQGELGLASELGLGMVVAVFCDNSLNRIELKQRVLGYPSTATTMAPSDVAGLAEAMGCDGAVASTPAELEKVLSEAGDVAALGRPLVIEARINPAQYEAQF